jgi:Fe-S-cluster-containing dehydrogenase component
MTRKLKAWERGHVVVYDQALCSGCRICETICSLIHEGVANPKYARIEIDRDVLNANRCTIYACMQCEDAACVEACPKDAIQIDRMSGVKTIREESCIGCGICIRACVVTPSRIRLNETTQKAYKCDLCGGTPQCVDACPMGALAFREVR